MEATVKKSAVILVVLFVGFYLIKDPTGFAIFLREAGAAIWNVLVSIFEVLIRFINALFS